MEENEKDAGKKPDVLPENSIGAVPEKDSTPKKAGKRDHAGRRGLLRENTQKRQQELAEMRNRRRLEESKRRAEEAVKKREEEAQKRAENAEKQVVSEAEKEILPAENLFEQKIPEAESDTGLSRQISENAQGSFSLEDSDVMEITEETVKESLDTVKNREKSELPVLEIDDEPKNTQEKPKKKRKKLVTALIVTGIVLVSLIVTGVIAAFCVFNYFYNQSNYIAEGETYIPTARPTEEGDETRTTEEIKEGVNYSLLGTSETTTETTAAEQEEEEPAEEPSINRTGVYNVLLIGIDIGYNGVGNSDSMIVCSINYDLHKIFLTTLMRDTQAEIPGSGTRKLNSACAIGGPTLLVDTLEQYFGFEIDNFAMIDFEGMKAVIDALGGVDLYITVEEAEFMKFHMDEDQMVHLDGRLALRHARDRSSGGYDFGRTQRQRNVLMAIVKKARNGGIGDLAAAAKAILPYITHNITRRDLAEILLELPTLVKWEFVQQRIPYDGMYHYENENLALDLPATMAHWRAVVYDGEIFEDTILEPGRAPEDETESTEESAGETVEESGTEAEETDTESPSGASEENSEPEDSPSESADEPENKWPDRLIKLPGGMYEATFRHDLYLKELPEDFKVMLRIATWKNGPDPDLELAIFDATSPDMLSYELGLWNDEYYIGRRGRFWKLEKYEGTE